MIPPAAIAGGLLNLNKPPGLTSFDIVHGARKVLHIKRVGHCGTLDPMATGVLLVVFGAATALAGKLSGENKVYRGAMRLGLRTDTGDVTGRVIEERPVVPPAEGAVRSVFQKFFGEIEQVPPMVSAIKFKGRPLYRYAREGITLERAPRKVRIDSLDLLAIEGERIEFRLGCSKGTYVRSLVEDIGRDLGLPATLAELVRERSGNYSIEESLEWEAARRMSREELLSHALPLPQSLP